MSGPLDFRPDDEPQGRTPEPDPAPPAEHEPEPDAAPPRRQRGPGVTRSTWVIGVVALVFVLIVIANAINGGGVDPGGPSADEELPPFAVPLAAAPKREDGNEDANVDLEKACKVRGPGILNICEQVEQAPVVFALFPTKASRCRSVLGQFDRVAPRVRGVRFVAVGSEGSRRTLAGDHAFPVGWDRDGGLATAYGLVGCPQITFARRGGEVVETTREELSDADLAAKARSLARSTP